MAEATPQASSPLSPPSLGASARASILWGGGFTLLRDVAQFGVMLILVRLLTPADYGTAALVQAIVGVFSMVSFGTFSSHALQQRNPDEIDWQAHFTAATVLNTAIAALVLALAFGLSFVDRYREAALPLAALAIVFLIEIPGTLRHRMLEVHHDWKRFRLMLIIGTFLGLGVGLAVGLMGGGVWALILQIPMLGIPAAIDLFVKVRFKPDWSWSWARYRETAWFGFTRVGAGGMGRVRQLVEQVTLSSMFDLATLGIFSRALGLANLLTGRIGAVAMSSVYPVVTRAERGSERFQRLSGLVLRGVCWTTVPTATFLGISAADTVQFLYGSQWGAVAKLLGLAGIAVGLMGIANALSGLLLANNETRAAFWLDVLAAIGGIALALILIPYGAVTYLTGLVALALVMTAITIGMLVGRGGVAIRGVAAAIGPAILAGILGAAAVAVVHRLFGTSAYVLVRLAIDAVVFSAGYLIALRMIFNSAFAELIEVAPGGAWLSRFFR